MNEHHIRGNPRAIGAAAVGWSVVALSLMLPRAALAQKQPEPPRELREVIGYAPLVLPDGTIEHLYTRGEFGSQVMMCIRSKDGGETWSEPKRVLALPPEGKFAGRSPVALIDRDGNRHLFFYDPIKRFEERTWHTRLTTVDQTWTPFQIACPKAPLTPPIQLKSGRIVLQTCPFVPDKPAWDALTGKFTITTCTSDDAGKTWQQSPQTLRVYNFSDFPGTHSGGAEPSLLELADGRVWMTIRTQNGWLYESFSDDGIQWSEPAPTEFRSSESPASAVRLPSGDIVLVWNNCDNPSPVDGMWIYTGRDALHAAISADEGKTWRGYREVYLDPYRNDDPPPTGDRGTSYANAAAAPDGSVYLVAGQGKNPRGDGGKSRYRLFRIDPAWLRLMTHADDFSAGLDGWSVFKSYGPASGWRRARVAGAQRVEHPSKPDAWALHVRRPDDKAGDGAAWNFPSGRTGSVTLRIRMNKGFAGGLITLTDRFIYPDDANLAKVVFALPLPPDGRIGPDAKLTPDEWHTLTLAWKVEHKPPRGGWPGECSVSVDGRQAHTLPQLNRAKAGLSYLRLHSTAPSVDPAGFLVERASAEIQP